MQLNDSMAQDTPKLVALLKNFIELLTNSVKRKCADSYLDSPALLPPRGFSIVPDRSRAKRGRSVGRDVAN